MSKLKVRRGPLAVFCLALCVACSTDPSEVHNSEIVIRLATEPDNMNPVRTRVSSAIYIQSLILLPICEYDPYTLELSPLLVESRAEVEEISKGEYTGGQKFNYRFREEATWDNGLPITGHDYAFTVKMALNPESQAPTWRGFLSFIKDVEVDPDDPKQFSVIVAEPYILAEVITCNFNLFPRHVYDPDDYLSQVTFPDLFVDMGTLEEHKQQALKDFGDAFASDDFNRSIVQGAGPYALSDWSPGQFMLLTRKSDWWGDKVAEAPLLLHGHPERIIYRFVPDETAAIAALKEGSLDLVSQVSAASFISMRDDERWNVQFRYLTPRLLQYRAIEYNLRDPILQDVNVRKALALCIDYDAIIQTVELGMADRTVGPFHPQKTYYHDGLQVLEQNLDTAVALLAESGWADTDNDGTVDKVMNGEQTELKLDILVTQRPAGQQVALLVQQSAARVGVTINISTQDNSAFRQAIQQRNFQLLPVQSRTSPSLSDPYQSWHSESSRPGGGNRTGFASDLADEAIAAIRAAENDEERDQHYRELQEILYEEQPAIFLCVPWERIIVNADIEMEPSVRRPGYFETLFQ